MGWLAEPLMPPSEDVGDGPGMAAMSVDFPVVELTTVLAGKCSE